jgi:hypothetical protein
MGNLSRRDLLGYSLACSLMALPCGAIGGRAAAAAAAGGDGYYLQNRQLLSEAFRQVVEGVQPEWQAEFGKDRAAEMARQALAAFEALLPAFPEVPAGTSPFTGP